MRNIANYFDLPSCRGIRFDDFVNKISELRKRYGARAVLRVMHFLMENERVNLQVESLEEGDFRKFLQLVKKSGNSSFKWLQNAYSCNDVMHQGITLVLSLSDILYKEDAVSRVHGGGFAGTIQVFVKKGRFRDLINRYKSIFGSNSVFPISIRDAGSITLNDLFT